MDRVAQGFFSRRKRQVVPLAGLPAGLRVYAIGDVHGRLDCLTTMVSRIRRHLDRHPVVREACVIFLGDYIDRGPDSRGVLDMLKTRTFAGLPACFVSGNHEDAMLHFLTNPRTGAEWLSFGGDTTLASYGIAPVVAPRATALQALARELLRRVPDDHFDFLRRLELRIELGGFLFVHAGIRPNIALDKQRRGDLLSIRAPFLEHRGPLAWRVVHGHTIVQEPQIGAFRISLDTGAFSTGRLSCAVIEGDAVTILD